MTAMPTQADVAAMVLLSISNHITESPIVFNKIYQESIQQTHCNLWRDFNVLLQLNNNE